MTTRSVTGESKRPAGQHRPDPSRAVAWRWLAAWLLLAAAPLVPRGSTAIAADGDGPVAEAKDPPVAWLTYREAKAEARHARRPLLVFFTASWSAAGARLDREVWSDRRLRRFVAGHLVAARVEFQEARAVAEHFDIHEPPALLALSPDGRPLVVLRGAHGLESYLRVATYAGSGAWEHADYATWLSRRAGR